MSRRSTKLEMVQKIFEENGITAETVGRSDEVILKIRGYAEKVKDYRHESYVRHPLASIIMIVFFAVLGNADEWEEIEVFAKAKEKWLRKYLDLPHGIPTDDTYRLVFGNIDTERFFGMAVGLLMETAERLVKAAGREGEAHEKGIVSVDGKESRGSKRKRGGKGEVRAYQTLNVYSDEYGMCIGQRHIEEKRNEIPAAQEVLGMMELEGTVVTADAMNCQKETASIIRKKGGDYVLALKGNQKLFHEDVRDYFGRETREVLKGKPGCYKETVEKEHGGVARRRYYITEDTGWYSEKGLWEGLRSFGMVHKTLERDGGETEEEHRYYICSIGEDAGMFERAARRHWGVENCLHWHMDFTFGDDRNRTMAGTGAKNLQAMKKIAHAVLRLVKESYRMSMRKIRYMLSLNYEEGVEKMFSLLDTDRIQDALQC